MWFGWCCKKQQYRSIFNLRMRSFEVRKLLIPCNWLIFWNNIYALIYISSYLMDVSSIFGSGNATYSGLNRRHIHATTMVFIIRNGHSNPRSIPGWGCLVLSCHKELNSSGWIKQLWGSIMLNHSHNSTIHSHQNLEEIWIPHLHLPGSYNTCLPSYANEPTA